MKKSILSLCLLLVACCSTLLAQKNILRASSNSDASIDGGRPQCYLTDTTDKIIVDLRSRRYEAMRNLEIGETFLVKKLGKVGVIDNQGVEIIKCEYIDVAGDLLADQTSFVGFGEGITLKKNNKMGFFNASGVNIVPCEYDNIKVGYYDKYNDNGSHYQIQLIILKKGAQWLYWDFEQGKAVPTGCESFVKFVTDVQDPKINQEEMGILQSITHASFKKAGKLVYLNCIQSKRGVSYEFVNSIKDSNIMNVQR